jgi:hypothetical protein
MANVPGMEVMPPVETSIELEGGSNAYRTHWVDVPVSTGSTVQLLVESGREGEARGAESVPLTVIWGEPALKGPSGELSLLDLPWSHATPEGVLRYEMLQHGAGTESDEGLLLGGRPLDRAISMKTGAVVRFSVPPGYDRLVAECGFDGAALLGVEGVCARCIIRRETPGWPRVAASGEAASGEAASGEAASGEALPSGGAARPWK